MSLMKGDMLLPRTGNVIVLPESNTSRIAGYRTFNGTVSVLSSVRALFMLIGDSVLYFVAKTGGGLAKFVGVAVMKRNAMLAF